MTEIAGLFEKMRRFFMKYVNVGVKYEGMWTETTVIIGVLKTLRNMLNGIRLD